MYKETEQATQIEAPRLKPTLLLIGGISGCGKTTMATTVTAQLNTLGIPVKRVVPYTTRQPRPGEVNGIDYWFVPKGQLEERISTSPTAWDFGMCHGQLYACPIANTVPPPAGMSVLPIHPHTLAELKATYQGSARIMTILIYLPPQVIPQWRACFVSSGRSETRDFGSELSLQASIQEDSESWDHTFYPSWNQQQDRTAFANAVLRLLSYDRSVQQRTPW